MCPPMTEIAKCVSKYLGIMKNIRKEIYMGFNLNPQDLNRKKTCTITNQLFIYYCFVHAWLALVLSILLV